MNMMAEEDLFRKDEISMPAMGRNFKLGDLYNRRNETILNGEHLSWKPASLASATRIKCIQERRYMLIRTNEPRKKVESIIGVDSHLKMSFCSGLLENTQGATYNYLNDHQTAGQKLNTCTIIFRATSREEKLDLIKLLNYQEPHLVGVVEGNGIDQKSDATHVVSAINYGAEAYCILENYVDVDDQRTEKEIVKNLTQLATEWIQGLCKFENVTDFKKRLTQKEKHSTAKIKCRLYAEFQSQPVMDYSFFDAYKQTVELMRKILEIPNYLRQRTAVPIAIKICPLQCLVDPNLLKVSYFKVPPWLPKCSDIFMGLKRVIASTEEVFACKKESFFCDSISQFVRLVCEYQELFTTKMKESLMKDRQEDNQFKATELVLRNSEKYTPLFKLTLLDQWIQLKQNELVVLDSMVTATGNWITLVDRKRLAQLLTESTTKNKYVVVLLFPPLDEKTNSILEGMKIFLEQGKKKKIVTEDPWYTLLQQKLMLAKIRKWATYVEKNSGITNQVKFVLTFAESSKPVRCTYLIYQSGKLLKDNLARLPSPPTGLRISYPPAARTAKRAKTSSSTMLVEWDNEDLGYPFNILLEYRIKGSFDSWIQRRTTEPGINQLSITVKTGSTLEIRVAADTCIGCSEFGDVLYTSSPVEEDDKEVIEMDFPSTKIEMKVTSVFVTCNSAKFEFSALVEDDSTVNVRAVCCGKGHDAFVDSFHHLQSGENPCVFENLEPSKTYILNVTDMEGNDLCDPVEFTTLGSQTDRFSNILVKQSEQIGNENGLDFYSVPLTQLRDTLKTGAERFVFGDPVAADADNKSVAQKHRTILLVGVSDSGKSPFINAMINYVFNVDWIDPFRFLVVQEEVDSNCNIKIYDIHHTDGLRIQHSLTVIDTPSYDGSDPEKNKKITEGIRKYFNDKNAIRKVDLVGFVMDSTDYDLSSLQLYIYCSLISIFGVEIRKDISFLLNYANDEDSPVLEAIDEARLMIDGQPINYFKFNTSAVFCDDQKELFSWCFDNFQQFFSSLAEKTTKSMSVIKRVQDMKNRLDATVNELKKRMETGAIEFRLLRETKQKVSTCSDENSEFQLNVLQVKNVFQPFGVYVTNCANCQMTCHVSCKCEGGSFNCDVMDHSMPEIDRTCRVCPAKCPWSVHRKDSSRFNYATRTEITTCHAIKEKYEVDLKKKLTLPNLILALNSDIDEKRRELVELVQFILRSIQRLQAMNERLFLNDSSPPSHSSQYWWPSIFQYSGKQVEVCSVLGQLIDAENADKTCDYVKRKKILENFRRVAEFRGSRASSLENRLPADLLSFLECEDNLLPFAVSPEYVRNQ